MVAAIAERCGKSAPQDITIEIRRMCCAAARDYVKEMPVAESLDDIKERYEALDLKLEAADPDVIDPACLLTFPYDYADNPAEVVIKTNEFTAVCPWTGLPDTGDLTITYVPGSQCIELKSLKYYLLFYRQVGIVQEHAASRILDDLVQACGPRAMTVCLDYTPRGGLHTVVTVRYPPETSGGY